MTRLMSAAASWTASSPNKTATSTTTRPPRLSCPTWPATRPSGKWFTPEASKAPPASVWASAADCPSGSSHSTGQGSVRLPADSGRRPLLVTTSRKGCRPEIGGAAPVIDVPMMMKIELAQQLREHDNPAPSSGRGCGGIRGDHRWRASPPIGHCGDRPFHGGCSGGRSWWKAMASTGRVSTNRTATVREWTTVKRVRSSTQE